MTDNNLNGTTVHINVFAGFIIIGEGTKDNVLFKEKAYKDAIRHISGMFSKDRLDYIEEFLYYNSSIVKKLKDEEPKPDDGLQLSLF